MFTFPVSRAASVTLETFKQFKDFFYFLFIYQLKTQIFPPGAASRAGNKQILKFLADLRAINVKEIKGVFKEPGFAAFVTPPAEKSELRLLKTMTVRSRALLAR